MDKGLQLMQHHQDSMENIQLFMMQISQLMRDLNAHIEGLGAVTEHMSARITRMEDTLFPQAIINE